MFILMKQAKKNNLFTCLLRVCVIFRINHVAKTISLLASRMPLYFLDCVFIHFFFEYSVHVFITLYM